MEGFANGPGFYYGRAGGKVPDERCSVGAKVAPFQCLPMRGIQWNREVVPGWASP